MRWFVHIEKRNINDIIKEIGEIRVGRNQRRRGTKKKCMEINGEDMKAYGVNKNMVKDKKRMERKNKSS